MISPTVNFQVLLFVLGLETIEKIKPRIKIEKKVLKQNLLKYLPSDFEKVIEDLVKSQKNF